jgi:ubiquinone biosynthesis protein
MNQIALQAFLGPPARFRARLEALGPMFIKFGQFLALRPDLLPEPYCEALFGLLDEVAPMPWATVHGILAAEYGPAYGEIFAAIEQAPVGAGALAQVHRAHLRDGTVIALKVLRPTVHEALQRDLRRLRWVARAMEAAGATTGVSPRDVIEQVGAWVGQEIDLTRELENVSRLHRDYRGHPSIVIPRPFVSLSTSQVLAVDFVEGVRLSELTSALRRGEDPDAWLAARSIDGDAFAETLIEAMLDQIFRNHFFHADPHPGNLMVLAGDRVGFVDFGLCDSLDATIEESQVRYFSAVYNGDTEQMISALLEILVPTDETDVDGFRRDVRALAAELADRRRAGRTAGAPRVPGRRTTSPLAHYMSGILRAAGARGLKLPAQVFSLYRALLTVETVASQIGADEDLIGVGKSFFRRFVVDRALQGMSADEQKMYLLQVYTLIRDAPKQVNELMAELSSGRLTLKVEVADAPPMARARNRQAKLLTTALAAVGVSFLLTRQNLPAVGGVPLDYPLIAVLVLLYLWTFLQWRSLK